MNQVTSIFLKIQTIRQQHFIKQHTDLLPRNKVISNMTTIPERKVYVYSTCVSYRTDDLKNILEQPGGLDELVIGCFATLCSQREKKDQTYFERCYLQIENGEKCDCNDQKEEPLACEHIRYCRLIQEYANDGNNVHWMLLVMYKYDKRVVIVEASDDDMDLMKKYEHYLATLLKGIGWVKEEDVITFELRDVHKSKLSEKFEPTKQQGETWKVNHVMIGTKGHVDICGTVALAALQHSLQDEINWHHFRKSIDKTTLKKQLVETLSTNLEMYLSNLKRENTDIENDDDWDYLRFCWAKLKRSNRTKKRASKRIKV